MKLYHKLYLYQASLFILIIIECVYESPFNKITLISITKLKNSLVNLKLSNLAKTLLIPLPKLMDLKS